MKSRLFAISAHASQKYGDMPYIYHLEMVNKILKPYGEQAQIIGYLHDTIEDTEIDFLSIKKEFGQFIAEAVFILTDEHGLTRKERKKKTYQKMKQVSGKMEIALVVKAADRLSNIEACIDLSRPDKFDMYKNENDAFKKAVHRKNLCEGIWQKIEMLLKS